MKTKDLLVAVIAYNEEGNLANVLKNINELPTRDSFDVVVVDDGSVDRTARVAQENGAKVLSHVFNLGYGCALQTAYKYACTGSYRYLIQMDGDGQHDACNIESISKLLVSDENPDLVIGSRFLSKDNGFKVQGIKLLTIKLFRGLIKLFTGKSVTDPTSGLQGMNRKTFHYNSLYQNFFNDYPDSNMIIQMILNNYKIMETGAVMHSRTSGKSMHSGLEPILYMMIMSLSIIMVVLREKLYGNRRKKMEEKRANKKKNA